jgi:uncharacterized protein YkwD
MLHTFRAATAALALGALAACAESPVAPASTTDGGAPAAHPASSTIISATRTVLGCDGATIALNAEEARTLDLHGATRRALGLAEFCVDSMLTVAARAHSQEMLAKGFFSHDSFDGRSFDVRIRGLGYPASRGLAENVAWGTGIMGEADDVYARWMASDSHHHNIVDGSLRRIGVGVVVGTYVGRSGARMYTVDFGTL